MNRLMRAEWYRYLHAGHFLSWTVFLCVCISLLMVAMQYDLATASLADVMMTCVDGSSFLIMLFPVFVAVIVGFGYNRKTAYYEVMAGNKISHMIWSKVMVDALPIAIVAFIFFNILPVVAYVRNGAGEVEHILARFALFFVIVLHICISAVLMATAIRHAVAAVVVYMRYSMVEVLGLFILSMIISGQANVPEWYQFIQHWFVLNQTATVWVGELTSDFIIGVFGSMILEIVLLYVVSYIGMKKKIYA